MIGTIICKADMEQGELKGYIGMLLVNKDYRNKGIGSKLAVMGIDRMIAMGCLEVMLETELINQGALSLYERLGFIKDEKYGRYYLNGGDAFRLRLIITSPISVSQELQI